MTDKKQCSERVYRSGYGSNTCSITATVEREVQETKYEREPDRYDEQNFKFVKGATLSRIKTVKKWYCGTHDPERVAARQAKKDVERRKERDYDDNIIKSAKELAAALGAGAPTWGRNGIEHAIKLSFDEAHKLLQRIRAAEEKVHEYEGGAR